MWAMIEMRGWDVVRLGEVGHYYLKKKGNQSWSQRNDAAPLWK